jgi:hypothetical protein
MDNSTSIDDKVNLNSDFSSYHNILFNTNYINIDGVRGICNLYDVRNILEDGCKLQELEKITKAVKDPVLTEAVGELITGQNPYELLNGRNLSLAKDIVNERIYSLEEYFRFYYSQSDSINSGNDIPSNYFSIYKKRALLISNANDYIRKNTPKSSDKSGDFPITNIDDAMSYFSREHDVKKHNVLNYFKANLKYVNWKLKYINDPKSNEAQKELLSFSSELKSARKDGNLKKWYYALTEKTEKAITQIQKKKESIDKLLRKEEWWSFLRDVGSASVFGGVAATLANSVGDSSMIESAALAGGSFYFLKSRLLFSPKGAASGLVKYGTWIGGYILGNMLYNWAIEPHKLGFVPLPSIPSGTVPWLVCQLPFLMIGNKIRGIKVSGKPISEHYADAKESYLKKRAEKKQVRQSIIAEKEKD